MNLPLMMHSFLDVRSLRVLENQREWNII